MERFSLRERAGFYREAFPTFPPLRADDRWLDGIWVLGNNYRGAAYYGSYPPGYLNRVYSLFPDRQRTLHAFSGSVAPGPLSTSHETTLDLKHTIDVTPRGEKTKKLAHPHVQGSVLAPPYLPGAFDLVLADTPYGKAEAKRYGVPYAAPVKVFRALASVVRPGGHLVWLDTAMPMFSRSQWHWWGVIGIVRSTNHKIRAVTMFERVS